MDIGHQQLGATDKFAVALTLDGAHGDGAAFVHIEAVGLTCIHLGMSCAIAHQRTLADLCVDAPRDEEGDVDVVVLELQRLIKAEQGVFCGTVCRA